jgi:uroporphyrinogen-III synthase
MSRFVLITRHPADCTELQELLAPSGITLRPYPVLRLEDVGDDAGWTSIVQEPSAGERPRWLVMASPRAPKRFVDQCRKRGAGQLLEIPIAVIGGGTAAATTSAGLEPSLIGPGTGLGLAEELNQQLTEPTTVIYACGHHRRPELPNALEAAGHTVVHVVVYRMCATPPRELPPLGPGLEAVVVTSPRAARLYLEGVGGLPLPCPHWALGPTTRDAARSMGIDCSIPSKPDLESLAEELCRI